MMTLRLLATAIAAATFAGAAHAQTAEPVKNVVLVHGAFADGSGWRGVHDELVARGYEVSVVQNPLTSLADDVAATRRALHAHKGPAMLVGHSYGGTVITEAGVDPQVAGLVYVAALAPDVGESSLDQFTDTKPGLATVELEGGFVAVARDAFHAGFAADVDAAEATFMANSQVPLSTGTFGAKLTEAAWKTKPSWFVVATADRAIDPRLLRPRQSASAPPPRRSRGATRCSSASRRWWPTSSTARPRRCQCAERRRSSPPVRRTPHSSRLLRRSAGPESGSLLPLLRFKLRSQTGGYGT